MRNFVVGMLVGITIAVCGYQPYQIEAEYRRNIAGGLAGMGIQSAPIAW